MRNVNPYRTPSGTERNATTSRKPPSKLRWAAVGFALGAALPVAFGVYELQKETTVGLGVFGPLAVIFVVGPFCGIIGAALGWAAAAIDGCRTL